MYLKKSKMVDHKKRTKILFCKHCGKTFSIQQFKSMKCLILHIYYLLFMETKRLFQIQLVLLKMCNTDFLSNKN